MIYIPTVTKITKDMILNVAFDIARENGLEGVSNREIARRMNCSIRPIYYQFKNVDELNSELYKKIEKYFYKFLIENMIDDVPKYKQIGINYIKFAKCENKLFQILFMSESRYLPEEFVSKDEGFNEVFQIIKNNTTLDEKNIKSFHTVMWIFSHGIATLVANNTVKLNEEEIRELLSIEFKALMLYEDSIKK